MVYLDPTNDIAFKKLFGDQARKELTISFLNSVLALQAGELIVDVIITDPYNTPDTQWLKTSIVDIRCTDQRGRQYIIELQVESQNDYPERSQYYACMAIARQLKQKGNYFQVMPVVFIGILDFNLFTGNQYLSRHRILDIATHQQVLKHLEFCFIELPKFTKRLEELDTVVDKWIYLLKHATEFDRVPASLKYPAEIEEAFDVLQQGNLSPQELAAYDRLLDARRVAESVRETHIQEGLKEGLEKGLEQGLERGLEQGLEQGLQKGLAQGRREVLQKLVKNIGLQKASELTGLSLQELADVADE